MIGLIKIEKQNLNCIIDNPELVFRYSKPFFISQIGEDIFHTVKLLYTEDVDVTTDNIVAYGNIKNDSITKEHLIMLRQEPYSIKDFEFYFSQLKKSFAKKEIEDKLLKEILVETSVSGDLQLDKLKDLVKNINDNIELVEGKEAILQDLPTLSEKYADTLRERSHGKSKYTTGDSILDSHLTSGFAPGQITLIYGATSIGKSMFALNLINKQINKRVPCVYVSLEMDETSTMDRLMSIRQQLPSQMFHPNEEGFLSPEVYKLLHDETIRLKKYSSRFYMVTEPSVSIAQLESIVHEAKQRMKVPYLVCTVDLLTMLSDIGQKPNEIEEAMNKLHILAKQYNIHLVAIVQANRGADNARIETFEQLDKLRPKTVHSIKNSNAPAERSRIIMSVFRPKYYAQQFFPEEEETDLMLDLFWVTIIKQSQGSSGGIVKYLFDPESFCLFPFIEENEPNEHHENN